MNEQLKALNEANVGAKVCESMGHEFGEYEVTVEPTCTKPGIEVATCTRCKATESRSCSC